MMRMMKTIFGKHKQSEKINKLVRTHVKNGNADCLADEVADDINLRGPYAIYEVAMSSARNVLIRNMPKKPNEQVTINLEKSD